MLKTLVLSVTYKCPIKCKYCGVNAGPHRNETMDLEMMKRMIDEAYFIGTVEVVVFTGGEPFLLGEDLYKAVEYAAVKGFLTRIVSNAYWATSYEKAYEVIKKLKDLGLTELNYSCDDFHQEYIPLESIKWASEAAHDLKIPALIAAKGIKNSKITASYLEDYFDGKLKRFIRGKKNPDNFVYEYGATVPVGWESEYLKDEDLIWSKQDSTWQAPCQSVLKSIVITPEGDLSICCGIGSVDIPETVIGNVHDESLVDLLIKADNDLMINWLAMEGPYGIMQHIQKRAPKVVFKSKYVNDCHLCHDIFSREEVREALSEIVEEMVPILGCERAWVENNRDVFKQKREESVAASEESFQNVD